MPPTSTFRRPLSTPDAKWIVEQACRAPSIHNTHPGRFHFDAGTFKLRADTRRGLSASDPAGRELAITCGAALFNLRVAVRKLGYTPTVSLLPDQRDPRLLARVEVGESQRGEPPGRR